MPRKYITRPIHERFWEKVERGEPDECWLWRAGTHGKYGRFTAWGQSLGAHCVAWIITNGEIPKGLFVCHTCDTPLCCNPRHLWLGTTQQNTADRDAKQRTARGERSGRYTKPERTARGDRHGARLHPDSLTRGDEHWTHKYPTQVKQGAENGNAKLTEADVIAIRAACRGRGLRRAVAERYGVSIHTVSAIVRRNIWKHLP